MTIIYFILVLSITVCVHEFGHFLFAKKAGIYVYEFSIGMGPRLLKFNRKNDETDYSIRLLPIGGYVQLSGESIEIDENIPENQRMQSKTWKQRFLTVIAGVMFNFIFAFIIFFIFGLVKGNNIGSVVIDQVPEGGSAYKTNLKSGMVITKINGVKVNNQDRFLLEYQISYGKTLELTTLFNGKEEVINVPFEDNYGFTLKENVKYGFFEAIKYAFLKFTSLVEQMFLIIFYLITGDLKLNALSGPIGIYNIVGESAKIGLIYVIYLMGYLSLNVGFINLLPIPAFDGGRILFMLIEKLRRKPLNPKVENTIHSIGFILLMVLMIIITVNDITRFR